MQDGENTTDFLNLTNDILEELELRRQGEDMNDKEVEMEIVDTDDLFYESVEDDLFYDVLAEDEVTSIEGDNSSFYNEPLYPGAHVSAGAFMLLIALFTTKHNLVSEAVQQLLNILLIFFQMKTKFVTLFIHINCILRT